MTYIERKKISSWSPRANVTRYAMPVSVESSILSTMIAAALVYARPTSGPIACRYALPSQMIRPLIKAVRMISRLMMHDVYEMPRFYARPAK